MQYKQKITKTSEEKKRENTWLFNDSFIKKSLAVGRKNFTIYPMDKKHSHLQFPI
jgi:hypothetical protein